MALVLESLAEKLTSGFSRQWYMGRTALRHQVDDPLVDLLLGGGANPVRRRAATVQGIEGVDAGRSVIKDLLPALCVGP